MSVPNPRFLIKNSLIDPHCKENYSNFSNGLNTFIQNVSNSKFATVAITATADSDLERIKTTREFFQWENVSPELWNQWSKSSDMSNMFRQFGNQAYHHQNFYLALRSYNLAVMLALTNSPELGIAFGNRSALTLEMHHPDLCIQDIDRALLCPHGNDFKTKLSTRRVKAQKALNNKKDLLVSSPGYILLAPNPLLPSAENFVKLDYQENCGRKLIVTQRVLPGTTLLVEKPYGVSLQSELDFDTERCHGCYKRIVIGVPCPDCPFVQYCTSDCRQRAYDCFHQLEHQVLPILFNNVGSSEINMMNERDILVLRIISKAGCRHIYELYQRSLTPGNGHDLTTHVYNSGYNEIVNLIRHPYSKQLKNLTGHDEWINIFRAHFLSALLSDHSHFFQIDGSREFRDFVGSLILRHYESIPFNAVCLSQLEKDPSGTLRSTTIGTGLFPTISLLNHSCAPNAIHIRTENDCETAVIVLRPIEIGDEVTITYGPVFTKMGREQRLAELERKYCFRCGCLPCQQNWKQCHPPEVVRCMSCSNVAVSNCSVCLQMETCIGILRNVYDQMEMSTVTTSTFHSHIAPIDFTTILKNLYFCIEFFNNSPFNYPFYYGLVAEELLKRFLVLSNAH